MKQQNIENKENIFFGKNAQVSVVTLRYLEYNTNSSLCFYPLYSFLAEVLPTVVSEGLRIRIMSKFNVIYTLIYLTARNTNSFMF